MLIAINREHFEPDVTPWADIMGPCHSLSDNARDRYNSDHRAEMFSAFNRLALLRRHGPRPWDRELRAMTFDLIKSYNRFAPKVLP